MELAPMQIDKVLLTIFISVLAGFFTAALSIVKLVNDKENKTTDYRQAWTDSLRKCFADLISNINLLSSCITTRLAAADQANEINTHVVEQEKELPELPASMHKIIDYFDKKILDEDAHIRELRRNLYQSYALTRLHFKPNDLSFSRVEQKFDVVIEMLEKLSSSRGSEAEAERLVIREKLFSAAAEITGYSRDILKTEWEAVKMGEGAYQQTKTWSLIGGGVALSVLLIFGVVTAWKILKAEPSVVQSKIKADEAEMKSLIDNGLLNKQKNMDGLLINPPQTSQVVTVYSQPNCPIVQKNENRAAAKMAPNSCLEITK